MIVFYLQGNILEQDKAVVAHFCKERFGHQAHVYLGKTELEISFDPEVVGIIASTVISVISLYFSLRQNIRDDREQEIWSLERIRKSVSAELHKFGVDNFNIIEIEGFDDFAAGKAVSSCRLLVTSEEHRFLVKLTLQGDAHIIEVV
jgi:hypothetical protein